ncbi:bactericidal permeability-increasing protein-like [Pseudorasbora parva]|uniref:bactericidal permeability-increasing protein-like n=1 Tax=Pseudorasbora parva TaxID=51549 RepID=UPI00351EA05E
MQLVIYFLMILSCTYADYPALKAVLTEKGLRGVSEMMSVRIPSELMSAEIPEFRGVEDTGMGTVKSVISNIRVKHCSMSRPRIEFLKGTGLYVEVSQFTIVIGGNWAAEYSIFGVGGSFEVSVYDIKISTNLKLGEDAGRLSITTLSCSDDVGIVNIHFYGTSFFAQPFVNGYRGKIADMIRGQICPTIERAFSELKRNQHKISVDIPLDQYIYLSVPLTSSPAITDQRCELEIKGEFYSRSSPSQPPFSSSKFKVQYADNYMLSVAASEFFINSAAYAYLRSGALQINIRDDMIPKSSPIHLNTTQFGVHIPQLRTLYPDMEMQVLLYASETPLFSFSSGVIDVHVLAAAKFSAVKPDGTLQPLFTLNLDVIFNGSVQIDKHLTGAFNMKDFKLILGSSEIGDFKVRLE